MSAMMRFGSEPQRNPQNGCSVVARKSNEEKFALRFITPLHYMQFWEHKKTLYWLIIYQDIMAGHI